MTIITLDQSYIDVLTELENECFSHPWSKEQLSGSLESGVFLGAVEGETLVGYVSFYFAADRLEILNLCVRPTFRRGGTAMLLLSAAETLAKKKNCTGMYLEFRESNKAAKELYQKNGYLFDGIRKNYYSNPVEHAVLMHKDVVGKENL